MLLLLKSGFFNDITNVIYILAINCLFRYEKLSKNLPKVSSLYRELLPALLPAAGKSLAEASRE
jgi:hypothetical protein